MFLLTLAALLLTPVPEDKKPVYYAATKVGDRREYSHPDGTLDHAVVVTKVEADPKGGLLVTEEIGTGDQTRTRFVFAVTAESVAAVSVSISDNRFSAIMHDPPTVLVRPLLKAGDKWDQEETLPDGTKQSVKYTAGGTEKVTVPAGTFDCVRVEVEAPSSAVTVWYAPGVGRVKSVYREGPAKGDGVVLRKVAAGK